jgi:hypothetical protein
MNERDPRTEVGIVSDARSRASRRGAVAARAAVRRVGLVSVKVGEASGLASDGEAGGVEGALERSWAIGPEILRAVGDRASLGGVDPHREVVTVDERHCATVNAYPRRTEVIWPTHHHTSRRFRQR